MYCMSDITKTKVDLAKIKKAVQVGIPLSITTYTFPHEAEVYYMSEVAKETPDVRADLVAEIKAKISDPSYLNSAVIESTADKILSSFGL